MRCMCGVFFCVWRGACVTKIDEDRLQRRDRNKRNVCVLGITFSGEQQENADNSKHDGTRSILPKLRPCNVGVLGITFSGEQQENADNWVSLTKLMRTKIDGESEVRTAGHRKREVLAATSTIKRRYALLNKNF